MNQLSIDSNKGAIAQILSIMHTIVNYKLKLYFNTI